MPTTLPPHIAELIKSRVEYHRKLADDWHRLFEELLLAGKVHVRPIAEKQATLC